MEDQLLKSNHSQTSTNLQNAPPPPTTQNMMSTPLPPPSKTIDLQENNNINTSVMSYANVFSSSSKIVSSNQNLNAQKILSQSKNSYKSPYAKPDYSDDTFITPKKDQGLIIESADGLRIKEYISAIGEIVGPDNILYASRFSKDRIYMYLKTKELVKEMTDKYDSISINETNLMIRPLILKATKYYLNRVCPSIPSTYLHDIITNLGINISSQIKREKMNNDDDAYSHIYSFRRTFYGFPEKDAIIPDSVLINYENENHRLFITTEIKRCSICHKIGHLRDVCKQKENEIENEKEMSNSNTSAIENSNNSNLIIINTNNDLHLSSSSLYTEINEMEMIDLSDSQNNASSQLLNNFPSINPKKVQSITPHAIVPEGTNAELKKIYDNVIISDIAFETFLVFLTKLSKKEVNNDEVRKLYSKQCKELVEILEALRGVTQSAMKARITRTLYKTKNIFKCSTATDKPTPISIEPKGTNYESENLTMESM